MDYSISLKEYRNVVKNLIAVENSKTPAQREIERLEAEKIELQTHIDELEYYFGDYEDIENVFSERDELEEEKDNLESLLKETNEKLEQRKLKSSVGFHRYDMKRIEDEEGDSFELYGKIEHRSIRIATFYDEELAVSTLKSLIS